MRDVVLLALLGVTSGCSLVFPLEGPPPSVCGRFVEVGPVAFGPELGIVSELSIDDTGARGFVLAREAPNREQRLTPIALGADDVWRLDAERVANLPVLHANENVRFGRIAPNGDLYASQHGLDPDYRVFRYVFTGVLWGAAENVSPLVPMESSFAGGAIEVGDGIEVHRHVPILHLKQDGDRYVSIASSEPGMRPWLQQTIDGRVTTDAINQRHEVTQASLALGPGGDLVLAYAASEPGDDLGSRLYAAQRQGDGTFAVGVPLVELDGDGDELEPWLARDCSTLHFRRGETIFTARAEAALDP